MDRNLQRPLIWLAALLASIPAVFAAPQLGTILDPLVQLVGPEGAGALYNQYPHIIDSIIAFIIFIAIGSAVFREKLGPAGKTVGVTAGVALSFAFGVAELQYGFNLGQLAPFVMIALCIGILYAMYWLVSRFITNKLAAASLAWILILFLLPASLAGFLLDTGILPWISLIGLIAAIILIVYLFSALGLGKFGGSQGVRNQIPSVFGNGQGGSAFKDHDNVSHNIDDLLKQINKQQQGGVNPTTVQTEVQELGKLLQAMAEAIKVDMTSAKTLDELENNIKQTDEGLRSANTMVKQWSQNPAFNYEEYRQNLQNNYIPQLQAFLEQQRRDFLAVQQNTLQEDVIAREVEIEEKIHKDLEEEALKEFDADKKIIEQLQRQETSINELMKNAKAVIDNPPPGGFGPAENIMKRFVVERYQLHLRDLQQVSALYNNIQVNLAAMRADHEDIRKGIAQRQKVRQSQKEILEKMPKQFSEYWPAVITAFSDVKSDASLQKASEGRDVLLQNIAELRKGFKTNQQIAQDIDVRLHRLNEVEPKIKQRQDTFLQAVQQIELQSVELESVATSVVIANAAVRQAPELSPQKAGLKAATILPTDLFAKNTEANLKRAKTFLDKQFKDITTQLDQHRTKSQGTPQESIFAETEKVVTGLINPLYTQWEKHIIEETKNADEQRNRAAQLRLAPGPK